MKREIEEYFEQLGMSESEAQLYLTLLETGMITVGALIKMRRLPRSSTYTYINQLMEKELVMKFVSGFRTYVAANPPEKVLPYLVAQKVQADKTMQDRLTHVLDTLHKEFPSQNKNISDKAEIKYYKGKLGVEKIYEEALKTRKVRSYVNLSAMRGLFPENSDIFTTAFKENQELRLFEIFEMSEQSKKAIELNANNERFLYKFHPEGMTFSAVDTLIFDGHVGIINVSNERVSGMIIKNREYYNNSKEVFDFVWKMLPEVKK